MSEKQYTDLYKQCKDLICSHSNEVMNAARDKAMSIFEQQGFPSRKVERYKYTDVGQAFAPDYGLNLSRLTIPAKVEDIFKCDVPNLSTHLAFVINDAPQPSGSFAQQFETFDSTTGIYVGSLTRAAQLRPELVKNYYAKAADIEHDTVAALNTALAQEGLFIYVPKNVCMEKPLQIINLLRSDVNMMINRRVLIVLEENAEATLLFCDHAMDNQHFLTNQVVEVFCAENSRLDMYELEETHLKCARFSSLTIRAGRGANVSHNNVTLFNGLTRNTTDVVLEDEYAEVKLNGCVVADKNQHVDNNTLIDHQASRCNSKELYKYVIDDKAVGAFAGRILVRPDAQKTTSQETNANLCASNDARMYTQPMLEIYADDVKCSHGSTVGVLDNNALFYMQQRGIPEAEARMLLKNAFVGNVIEEIQLLPLRERLHYLVEKRFRGELNKCTGCALCK